MFLTISFTGLSQTYKLSGVIKDSLQKPVSNANIIAKPMHKNEVNTVFSISSSKGKYSLKLKKDEPFLIEVSHLGFQKISDTLSLKKDQTINYTLFRSNERLEEVVIEQEMAVVVKEDTITYRTDRFKTGNERKLKDILKKLPGVEVDKAGNVKVKGKPVSKLMVDGKSFFNGDEKLGVNNIPADAVDEVQALDDYNEVAFLKDLEDSDKMALDIKLKDGKKKFAFGDIEGGAGIEERFLVHPKLFYYSPNTAINLIGDINNIGQKSFTVQDYLDLEGGMNLALEDQAAYSKLLNDDFAQFLQNRDFTYNKNDFAAGSIYQDLGRNLSVDAYSIFNKSKVRQSGKQDIDYQTSEQSDEIRTAQTTKNLIFNINKIKLRYSDINSVDLRANTILKYNEGDRLSKLNSRAGSSSRSIINNYKPDQLNMSQVFNLNKQFSYKHTSKVELSLQHKDKTTDRSWDLDQALFTDIIPLIDEGDNYKIDQKINSKGTRFKFNAKHYWIAADHHHLYPIVGLQYFDTKYQSMDQQILNDGTINNFNEAGFNNNLNFQLLTGKVGFQYKTQIDKLTLKPGLVYQIFDWKADQLQMNITDRSNAVLLPELLAEYDFNKSENLKLEYNRYSNFTSISNFATRLRLLNFNQLYKGNENLENQVFNRLRILYSKFDLFSGLFINAGMNYSNRETSIRDETQIQGIDQITQPIFTDLAEESFNLNGGISKKLNDYRFSLDVNGNWSTYSRIINQNTINYRSNQYTYNIKVKTNFDKMPNVELGYRQSFSELSSNNNDNDFMRIMPNINVNYSFFKNFLLKANYNFTYFENEKNGNTNHFDLSNVSLSYNKEESPWNFEISSTNIFDTAFRQESNINEFTAIDNITFIQPRILLFSITYKL